MRKPWTHPPPRGPVKLGSHAPASSLAASIYALEDASPRSSDLPRRNRLENAAFSRLPLLPLLSLWFRSSPVCPFFLGALSAGRIRGWLTVFPRRCFVND